MSRNKEEIYEELSGTLQLRNAELLCELMEVNILTERMDNDVAQGNQVINNQGAIRMLQEMLLNLNIIREGK